LSQFQFLAIEWGDIASAAMRAEAQVHSDPRAACFYSRRALELGIHWLYRNDNRLKLPYQDHLSALIHEPTFVSVVGPVVWPKLKLIKDLGNLAGAFLAAIRPVVQSQVRLRVGAASAAGLAPSTLVLANGFE